MRRGECFEKHGESRTPLYGVWSAMKRRCYNPNDRCFYLYGGRGITVCDRWRYNYLYFKADMEAMPTPQHSLERINCDGNYEPSNCTWATAKEQANNRRNTRTFTFNGETLNVRQWSERTGINYPALYKRLCIKGYPIKDALTRARYVRA